MTSYNLETQQMKNALLKPPKQDTFHILLSPLRKVTLLPQISPLTLFIKLKEMTNLETAQMQNSSTDYICDTLNKVLSLKKKSMNFSTHLMKLNLYPPTQLKVISQYILKQLINSSNTYIDQHSTKTTNLLVSYNPFVEQMIKLIPEYGYPNSHLKILLQINYGF